MAFLDTSETSYSNGPNNGCANSLFELGLIYATGRDGEPNLIAAHKWFNIAAYRGLEAAKARREEIAKDMSRDEIAVAQREAREWITQH